MLLRAKSPGEEYFVFFLQGREVHWDSEFLPYNMLHAQMHYGMIFSFWWQVVVILIHDITIYLLSS